MTSLNSLLGTESRTATVMSARACPVAFVSTVSFATSAPVARSYSSKLTGSPVTGAPAVAFQATARPVTDCVRGEATCPLSGATSVSEPSAGEETTCHSNGAEAGRSVNRRSSTTMNSSPAGPGATDRFAVDTYSDPSYSTALVRRS